MPVVPDVSDEPVSLLLAAPPLRCPFTKIKKSDEEEEESDEESDEGNENDSEGNKDEDAENEYYDDGDY